MAVMSFRERSPVIIGIVSILLISGGMALAFRIDSLPAVKQAYDIKAEFADAAGLKVENQVRIAGLKVGAVSDVELDGDRVLVTMEIENGIDISDDATAEIKLATLLGTKFVQIEARGGAPYLQEGDLIPLERTDVPYEIYQAANEGVAVVERLDGPALNDLLVELTELTAAAEDEVGEALDGLNALAPGLNDRREDLHALLKGSSDLTKLLSEEGDQIVRLVDASNDTLGLLASKREEIQSLLEVTKRMAGDLGRLVKDHRGELDSILAKLHRALKVLDDNIEHIDVALRYAGRSSRYFASVFQQGPWGDLYTCVIMATVMCENDE